MREQCQITADLILIIQGKRRWWGRAEGGKTINFEVPESCRCQSSRVSENFSLILIESCWNLETFFPEASVDGKLPLSFSWAFSVKFEGKRNFSRESFTTWKRKFRVFLRKSWSFELFASRKAQFSACDKLQKSSNPQTLALHPRSHSKFTSNCQATFRPLLVWILLPHDPWRIYWKVFFSPTLTRDIFQCETERRKEKLFCRQPPPLRDSKTFPLRDESEKSSSNNPHRHLLRLHLNLSLPPPPWLHVSYFRRKFLFKRRKQSLRRRRHVSSFFSLISSSFLLFVLLFLARRFFLALRRALLLSINNT